MAHSVERLIARLPSARLQRMANSLLVMARALDEEQAAHLASGKYERATDDYLNELLAAYDHWVKRLLKALGKTSDVESARQIIVEQLPDLRSDLQLIAQEFLPTAVSAMSDAYVPSADAYRLIADAITQNNGDIETRLMPAIEEKLLRAVVEGTPLQEAADSMTGRVSGYAGSYWVLLQRFIGDFAAQAESGDDEIYKCEWVCVGDDRSCDSCLKFAGVYESYNAMLTQTFQCVPGYFFNSPYASACWGYCRCYLRLLINGVWKRV